MPKVVVFGTNSFSGQDFFDLLLDEPIAGSSASAVRRNGRVCF